MDARQVGGAPQFRELVVYFGEERERVLTESLMAPRKKTLIQPAVRWFLRRRPFEPELVDSLCHNLSLREADDGKRAGSITEPDNSSASEATRERLSSSSLSLTTNKIMSLTATEGRWSCWVKRTGECSPCVYGEVHGHWAGVSSLVTSCSNPLPRCFFLTGPWEEKRGWREEWSRSLKRKLSVNIERQDWISHNESSQSSWAQRQRGISPSMTHTQRECHPCAGKTCTSYNDSAAFVTTPWNLLFGSTPDGCRGWSCLQAGRCEMS